MKPELTEIERFWRILELSYQGMDPHRSSDERANCFVEAMELNTRLDGPRHEYFKALYYLGRCRIPGRENAFGPGMQDMWQQTVRENGWYLPPPWQEAPAPVATEQVRKAS